MRHIQRAALLAATALLAIAAMAPAANASGDPVLLKDMSGGAPGQACPAVTKSGTTVTGGCVIQYATSAPISYTQVFGPSSTFIQSCNETFTARVDSAGHGWITNVALTGGNAWCASMPACDVPWEIQFHKDASGAFHAHSHHCVNTFGYGQARGELELDVPGSPYPTPSLIADDDRLLPGTTGPTGWIGKTVDGTWTRSGGGPFQIS